MLSGALWPWICEEVDIYQTDPTPIAVSDTL
jgi:hypothetical protein